MWVKLLELVQRYINYYFCWGNKMVPTEVKTILILIVILIGIAINVAVPMVVNFIFDFINFEIFGKIFNLELIPVEKLSNYVEPVAYFIANAMFFRKVFRYTCEEDCVDSDEVPYKEKYEKCRKEYEKLYQEYKFLNAYFNKKEGDI